MISVKDKTLKDELQKEVTKAQDMLNAKNAVKDLVDGNGILKPGVGQKDIDNAQKQLDRLNKPIIGKPNAKPGSTSSNKGRVNTGDETNLGVLYGLLAVSLAGIAVAAKRRKKEQ